MPEIDISTQTVAAIVLVDECDLPIFDGVRWTPEVRDGGLIYATRRPDSGKVYLHRLIMAAQTGDIVDHINRNGLDNRRSNLRLVTAGENARNRAGRGATTYRGVHLKRGRWQASIGVEGVSWSLGRFDTPEEAAAAYDDALAFFGLTGEGWSNLPQRTPIPRQPTKRNIAPNGFPGVRRLPSGRFGARIIRGGKRFSIGVFDTAEEASKAASEGARRG